MTRLDSVTPILRIFDEAKAREFYLGFLGFSVVFEHRFGNDCPLYMGLVRDGVRLHLSEHHGDACPGARIRIRTTGLNAYARALREKDYRFARPGDPEPQPWGEKSLTLTDPFGNRLTFSEDTSTEG